MKSRTVLPGAAIAMAWAGLANAQPYGPGMMWDHGWGLYGVMHLLWWGLAALVVVMLLRRGYHRHDHGPQSQDRALAILRERYARGEIDKTEFEARKRDLAD